MSLVKIVNTKPVAYDTDYWAMHIAAALLCMHDHPGLAVSPERLLGDGWRTWSLSEYRGHAHPATFRQIQAHVGNWGAQYLIADILNRDLLGLLNPLLAELAQVHGAPLISGQAKVECRVSGIDSRSSRAFLQSCRARILSDRRRRVNKSLEGVKNADICLLVYQEGQDPVAIFGEVEGNHGERLRRNIYWGGKSPFALFGVGVLPGQVDGVTLETINLLDVGPKVLMLFGTAKNVMADFADALSLLEMLFQNGPSAANSRFLPAPVREISATLAASWNLPIVDLISLLHPVIADTYVETLSGESDVITTPAIIAA